MCCKKVDFVDVDVVSRKISRSFEIEINRRSQIESKMVKRDFQSVKCEVIIVIVNPRHSVVKGCDLDIIVLHNMSETKVYSKQDFKYYTKLYIALSLTLV